MDSFDKFSILFWGDKLLIGKRSYPLGEITTEFLNMDSSVFADLQGRTDESIPAAREMLASKNKKIASEVQEKLNAVFHLLITLPPYRDLALDTATAYDLFPSLVRQSEKWEEATTPDTAGHDMMQKWLASVEELPGRLQIFLNQIDSMLWQYFEPLSRRSPAAYAFAFTNYYRDAMRFTDDLNFEITADVAVSYVPIHDPNGSGRPVIAEKTQFYDLVSFLHADFYRGLMQGNAPRRCHNCGKYFLLTAGYNTCYCNNIAPGEKMRTCRKVGAHNKEAKEKASATPAQREYRKAYNRLKTRKNRGKITAEEWNGLVAQAQDLKEQADQGKLSDEELKEKLAAL